MAPANPQGPLVFSDFVSLFCNPYCQQPYLSG